MSAILIFPLRCTQQTLNIIAKYDQQYTNILVYLFISNQFYMFQAMSSPIIRSTWLYLQLMILSADTAAGWYHGWDGTDL